MRRWLFAAVLLAAVSPACAQTPPSCAPLPEILKRLSGAEYAEQPLLKLKAADGTVFHIYANIKTQTWTAFGIAVRGGKEIACIMSYGEGMAFGAPAVSGTDL